MDTGVLSIIFHQFPYSSHWTRTIASILFVMNIILFLVFGLIYIAHWSIYYKTTSTFVRAEAEEIALQACPAISWLTIATDVQLICGHWGYGFTIVAYVMWWVAVVWVVTICILLFLHLMKYASTSVVDQLLPTAVFVPIVGIFTVANLAGIIATQTADNVHVTSGMITSLVIIGFLLVGFGGGLAIVMYAIYMHRLMTSGWPAALKIPSMILTVNTTNHRLSWPVTNEIQIGPCGQSATALLNLSGAAVANHRFDTGSGFFLTTESANIIHIQCVLLACLISGYAVFWLCIDYYAIVEGLIHHKIHPSLFWWSTIFPVGAFVTALIGIATALDSPAVRVIAIILFVFIICVYLFNATFTIPMTLNGEFLGLSPTRKRLTANFEDRHHWGQFPRKHRVS